MQELYKVSNMTGMDHVREVRDGLKASVKGHKKQIKSLNKALDGKGLLKSLKKARKKVNRGLSKAGDAIKSGVEDVGDTLTDMTSKMHQQFGTAADNFQKGVKATVDGLQHVTEGITEVAGQVVEKLFPNGKDSVGKFLGKVVRVEARSAIISGTVIAVVGDMMVLTGEFTGQPELIAAGLAVDTAGNAIVVGGETAMELADALQYTIQGDQRAAMIALAKAVEVGTTGILNTLTKGTFDNFVAAAIDMSEGDYEGATRQLGQAALDAMADELNIPSSDVIAGSSEGDLVNRAVGSKVTTGDSQGYQGVDTQGGRGMKGGQEEEEKKEPEGANLEAGVVTGNVDFEQFPGGRVEAASSGATSLPIAPPVPKNLERENQNLDAELTMCGGNRVTPFPPGAIGIIRDGMADPNHKGIGFVESMQDLNHRRAMEFITADIPGPRAKRRSYVTSEMEYSRPSFSQNSEVGRRRSYGALTLKKVEFANAGIAVGTGVPFSQSVRKQRTKDVIPSSRDPMRENFRKRNTVRGFDSPYIIKKARTSASGTRDARGEMVKVNRHVRGHRGRVHGDVFTELREKSMKQIHTLPVDVVVKGADRASSRSRSVRRSTRIHEREMKSVLAHEGL